MSREVLGLLEEAKRAGVTVTLEGRRLVFRGPESSEELMRRLVERKRDVAAVLRREGSVRAFGDSAASANYLSSSSSAETQPPSAESDLPPPNAYQALACSPLAARCAAAMPWLAEHRPDLFSDIRRADDSLPRREDGTPDPGAPGFSEAVERLRKAMEVAAAAYERRAAPKTAVRIYSRVLGAELWIAADEEAASELLREGVTIPVVTASEAEILARASGSDSREILKALTKIQRVFPGARLPDVRLKHDA